MCKKLSFVPLVAISVVLFILSIICFLFMFTDTIKDLGVFTIDNTATEQFLEALLMPTKEKLLEKHRVCNAYEHDNGETAFLNFTDPVRRKYEFPEGDQASSCSTNTRTKYFLYHVTNLDDVVNHSAVPIVEKRGPWVFKKETRDYVLNFADEDVDGKTYKKVTYSSRSWHVVDDAETRRLCQKCSTVNLCAAWPEPVNAVDFPTNCIRGTLVGDPEYNTITVPNVAYLHALEVLDDLGFNENFISYALASKALSKFYRPQTTLAEPSLYPTLSADSIAYDRDGNAFDESLLSNGEKLLLTEMASGIKAVKQELGGDISGPTPSASFEYQFRNATFLDVPPPAPGSAASATRRINYNLLNVNFPAGESGASITNDAFSTLFNENGKLQWGGEMHDVNLVTIAGLHYWLNVESDSRNANLCTATTGTTYLERMFDGTYKIPQTVLCEIYRMVKNMHEKLLQIAGASSVQEYPAVQWAQSKVLAGYYFNSTNDFEFCPYGTSVYDVAPYNVSLKDYAPPELSCFLRMFPSSASTAGHQHGTHIQPSTIVPRSINSSDLANWTSAKASKWFWFVTGANVTDGTENFMAESTAENGYDGRPKYADLNIGWSGLATASLHEAYGILTQQHLANFIAYPTTKISVKDDISTYFFKSAGSAIKSVLSSSFSSGGKKLLFNDVAAGIKAIYDAEGGNFKTNFFARSFSNVPPTGAPNSPRFNYNLLNNQNLAGNLGSSSSSSFSHDFGVLFGGTCTDDNGIEHVFSLFEQRGVEFWWNQSQVNTPLYPLECFRAPGGQTIGNMVKNITETLSGTDNTDDVPFTQWASADFYGKPLRNGATEGKMCPRGASIYDIQSDQRLATPPELACFVELYPPSSEKIEMATLVPRSLSGSDFGAWSISTAKKMFWLMSGLNVVDGSEFNDAAPNYNGVNIGWAGLSVAALNDAYFNLTESGIPELELSDKTAVQSTSSAYRLPYSTLNEKCGMTFWKKLSEVGHHATTISAFQASNSMITCRELQTLVSYTLYINEWIGLTTSCSGAFETALLKTGYFNTTESAKQFIGDLDLTCKELQTMTSYTNYIADSFVWKPHVRRPRCSLNQTNANFVCQECQDHMGCKKVNEPLVFPSGRERESSVSFDEIIHKELCYLPNSNVLNSTCLNYKQTGYLNCSDIDPKYCSAFKKCSYDEQYGSLSGDQGGLFVTLNSSSLFNGWSDPLLDQFEEMGVDLGIPSYGHGILVNEDDGGLGVNRDKNDAGLRNSPYHNLNTRHKGQCWETSAFKDNLLEDGIRTTDLKYVESVCDSSTNSDTSRAHIYKTLSSVEKQQQAYQKPCHYKRDSHLRTSFYGKDKLFQLSEMHGFKTIKGVTNRDDPLNTFFDPTADTWGYEASVEGYDGERFPPAFAVSDAKETYEGIQSEEKKERAEKIISENRDTVFPWFYKIWSDFTSRPLIYRYSELVESEIPSETQSSQVKVRARRFLPIDLLTRYTGNKNSSDALGGAAENPTCLINLKKVTNLPAYFGLPDFHSCPVDNLIEVTTTDQNSNNLTNILASFFNDSQLIESLNHDYNDVAFEANITKLHRSKIVNPADISGGLHYSSLPYLDIEPVTGITIGRMDKESLYMRVKKTRVFARNLSSSVVPYFQSESVSSAKADQLDSLQKALKTIASNAERDKTIRIAVLILGILLAMVGLGICIYAVKTRKARSNTKSEKLMEESANGPSTPKGGPVAAVALEVEMPGMQIRKTMKVVDPNEIQMEGYKGAKLQAIKPPVRTAKTPRGFRAGHVFDDDDDDLPPGWVSIKDEESGDYYYYNAAAGLTQWEKPVVKPPPRNIQAPKRTAKTPKGFRKGTSFEKSLKDLKQTAVLPPGWEQCDDDGDVYFYNTETGESQWEMPEPIKAPPRTAKTPKGFNNSKNKFSKSFRDLKKTATLAPGWEAIVEASSGDTYYFNKDTGETSWEEPKPIQAPPRTAKTPRGFRKGNNEFAKSFKDLKKTSTLAPGWEAIVDADSGDYYYFNKDTGETSWEEPKPIQAPPRTAKTPRGFRNKGTAFSKSFKDLSRKATLPDGWEAIVDEDSDDTYFFNKSTGETTWDPPIKPPERTAKTPKGFSKAMSFSSSIHDYHDLNEEVDLLPNWETVVDDEGDTYYWNSVTGETQWDKPIQK